MAPPRKTLTQYETEARKVGSCLIHPSRGAARKVYILRHGPLTRLQYVCHTCDTPACIEDRHHFLGSCKDNVQDAVAKGRHSGFRKGGVRFAGSHSEDAKAKIGRASKSCWQDPEVTAKRVASLKAAQARKTPEERTALALKTWEIRRANSSNLS